MQTSPTRIGRPREERVDAAVRLAVLDLLAEEGYSGATMDRIASRAGVGKGALYRRWRSKAELVFAATVHPVELGPPPDTKTLQGDLEAVAMIVRARLVDRTASAALAALASELRAEPDLADTLEQRLFAGERRWMEIVLDRARARGELRPEVADPELVRQALIGPIALAVLFSPGAPAPAADQVAALVARGLVR